MREAEIQFFTKAYSDLVQTPLDIADMAIEEHRKQIERLENFKRAVRAAGVAVTEVATISLPASETHEVKALADRLKPKALSGSHG